MRYPSKKVETSEEQREKVEPFTEAVSLQNVEHPPKHAVFLSGEVQSSFQTVIQLSFIPYVIQNTRFLHNMQCVINIQSCWVLPFKSAVVGASCSIPWKKMVVKGKCCSQVIIICLGDKIFTEIRTYILVGKLQVWKGELHPQWELSLPGIFLYDHCSLFKERLNFFKMQ